MENNLLRIVLLVLLFFLLTSDYAAIFKQVMVSFVDENETGTSTIGDHRVLQENNNKIERANENDNNGVSSSSEQQHVNLEDLLDDPDHYTIDYKNLRRDRIINAVKNSCLPKLICELNASENKENLSPSELGLLNLIRDTSISATAEVTSKYHFAAHMGQLIAGIEGTGCHNFYPDCPIQGFRISSQVKVVKGVGG